MFFLFDRNNDKTRNTRGDCFVKEQSKIIVCYRFVRKSFFPFFELVLRGKIENHFQKMKNDNLFDRNFYCIQKFKNAFRNRID